MGDSPHPTTQPYKGKAFAFDPRMVPEYQKLADAVHVYGTLYFHNPGIVADKLMVLQTVYRFGLLQQCRTFTGNAACDDDRRH